MQIETPSAIALCVVALLSMFFLTACSWIDRGQDVTGFWQDQDRKGANRH